MDQKPPTFAFSFDHPKGQPITNSEFLDSYVRLGAWLRLIHVYEQLRIIKETKDPIRRLAAVASVFSALGALVEDVSATLLGLMAWNRADDLLIADALHNVAFAKDTGHKASKEYLEKAVDTLIRGKRARVDSQVLAKSLTMQGAIGTLALIGLPWKENPSVKIARGDELAYWRKLPKAIEQMLTVLSSESTLTICLAHNKIKHGPQLVVGDLVAYLRQIGASTELMESVEGNLKLRQLSRETLRILFNGAATAQHADDPDSPTIWLDDDTDAIRYLLAMDFYNLGKVPWFLVMWLRKRRFGRDWSEPPEVVKNMEEEVTQIRGHFKAMQFVKGSDRGRGPLLLGGLEK